MRQPRTHHKRLFFGIIGLIAVLAIFGPKAAVDTDGQIILQLAGTAYAGFWIWLGVRIINRREKWAFILAVATLAASAFAGMLVLLALRTLSEAG
jgi:hypothetical protein